MADKSSVDHNYSSQSGVDVNLDPAFDFKHEHGHEHLHHSAHAEQGRHDEIKYTTGTTFEPSLIPDQYHTGHVSHQRRDSKTHAHSNAPADIGDAEKGSNSLADKDSETSQQSGKYSITRLYKKYRLFVHVFIFLLFTGWWIASLVLHVHNKNWIIPFLLWGAITLRLLFFHIPITIITRPMHYVWNQTGVRVYELIPEKFRIHLGAWTVIAVILIGSFVSKESADNTRANRAVSLFGLVVFTFVLYATSHSRKHVNWHTVWAGLLCQFIIGIFVLRTKAGFDIFNFIATLARELLGFAKDGVAFLTTKSTSQLSWFLLSTLPAVLFFVAFVSLLSYWGILQFLVIKFAIFFFWMMRVSGAESVVAAASPFIGQGENVLLIRPFVPHLTMAEIHQVMTSGFATISGSVLIAYIGLGVNGSALISSCVMSIPASLALSKLRWPETEETLTAGRVVIPDDDEHKAFNSLHAFANGAWLGIKIAGTILATVLCVIAIVGLIDGLLSWWGSYININHPTLTLELILGYICYPVAFLMGVPRTKDLYKVGQLIGVKLIENEFVAYTSLQSDPQYADLSQRSRLITTYALCGFANIGSLGTQIGVLSQVAPGRSGDISRVAFSALITGALATFTSASIAGMLVTDQRQFFAPSSASSSS